MSTTKQFMAWWSEQGQRRQGMYGVLALALVIAMGSIFYYSTRVDYVPLFSGLDPKQASSIVESLKQEKVAYQLTDGGTSVLVPKEQLYELKIRIAGEGLYNSGIGFELFDQVKLGITDFERRLNYQRALQEELRRTISYYPEVEQVRVHLVIPEPSVFVQTAEQASASITLKLRPFKALSSEQVKGMAYLVALSVPKLKPENVSIVDVSGRILTDGLALGDNSSNPTALKQAELKRGFESEVELKLLQLLERIYGPGKAVAIVTAEMNFDQETVTRIIYDKEGQVIRSEQVREESYSGDQAQGGGVAGTGSNVPLYPTTGSQSQGGGTYQSTDRSTQYEIDTTQSTVVVAPGRVVRLSTAVSVNANLTTEQKEQLNQLVQAAVGYAPDRGDSIVVTALNFSMEHVEEAKEAFTELARQDRIRQYINYGMIGAGALLGFIVLMTIISRIGRGRKFEVPKTEPVSLVPLQKALAEAAAARSTVESDMALTRVKELAKQQPEEVAQLIKAWFNEG